MEEKKVWQVNGFVGLLVTLVSMGIGIFCLTQSYFIEAVLLFIVSVLMASSITIVQPNQAAVVTFFGKYIGIIRESGIFMTVPLTGRKKVSLRVRNFNSARLKVNDVNGNPIEIAAVIVFKVVDSAKAIFDVDEYEKFVEIQSETALRHVATKYPYDSFTNDEISLRSNTDIIATELGNELQARLDLAGIEVLEARLTHLAYSTEIASAMLQRQQASAILAARQIIVEGAVGMAQLAIEHLEKDGTVTLDEERKAQMINNLMVAIVTERAAQPVINTGTLY